ncbi:hypothetical protein [Bathymodiolus platifrons methanotrophic gill symbiont]|uniref:hypothetical protein n=1 Tax=Bathymodiolus platifrons methanotrophic gill symbiont TaxID=113268 RepID=UPI000B420098|nr:hypothetical protein [Bathymodiolus platifrons methanotrophic gill symbiont]
MGQLTTETKPQKDIIGNEELQVKRFEAGKTYTIQVYMQDLDDEGFAWVHVWRSLREPIHMS